ncbi:uncharacterized protein LOC122086886 [Macadamia integrifolia]|uniref:uncharacterized protein LOC122086886 n=1 Tax=Macadamia integrifolia TaxID=60698 RepID=UPI001C4FF3B9|nr:uncharacterized protein LOC122086886 [Macadamia integrifolia]
MADRLHGPLHQIISPTQSAFIPNCLISDNILVAHEMFLYIKRRKKGKDKFLALKLDMGKAYDILEWTFIEAMLLKLGFLHYWVSRVMSCIQSVSYSLLINGCIKGSIAPTRGIRQGDPIHQQYLFYAHKHLLQLSEEQRGLESYMELEFGIEVLQSPTFYLLMIVFFFSQVKLGEISSLNQCLDLYCKAMSQEINLKKSSLTFSPNTHVKFKRWLSRVLKVPYCDGPSKYLGLPTDFGISKKDLFREVKEQTLNKLQGWKKKYLSHAEKEILLKASLSPMSNFAGSHFKLAVSHHEDVRKAASNFYWGDSENDSKIHWISWERLGRSKNRGGFGFRDSRLQNQALLAKAAWRLWSSPETHWARFIKSIYFPTLDFLRARLGHNPSWGWCSILEGRDALQEGLLWQIGDGALVDIWQDKWIQSLPHYKLQYPKPVGCTLSTVANIIGPVTRYWRLYLLQQFFHQSDRDAILKINLSLFPSADKLIWGASKDGVFSVKLVYHLLSNLKQVRDKDGAACKASTSRCLQ